MSGFRQRFPSLARLCLLLLVLLALGQANPADEPAILALHEGVGGRVEIFENGTDRVLTAIADDNYRFSEWECLDTVNCPMFLSSATSDIITIASSQRVAIKANFELADAPADMGTNGTGAAMNTTLALQAVDGSSVSVAASCGADCVAGQGWTATLNATTDEGLEFVGWRCVDAAVCPAELAEATSATVRFQVAEQLQVAPELAPFRIVTNRAINFQSALRRVQAQAICGVQGECVFLTTNSSANLSVDAVQGAQRSFEWSFLEDSPHLSFANQNFDAVEISVGSELADIVISTIAVESAHPESSLVARDTIKVVAIPSALAVQVGGNCSGFALNEGENYYVVTAGHCLDEFGEISIEVGLTGGERVLAGTVLALDEVGDIGVIQIPNPDLDWIPGFAPNPLQQGENVRLVGRPHYGLLVTASDYSDTEECTVYFEPVGDSATGDYRPFCEWDLLELTPNPGEPGFSGGALLDASRRLVGVFIASGDTDGFLRKGIGTRIRGVDDLTALLARNSRCITRAEHTADAGTADELTAGTVDSCAMR